jgi:hypothetical protein
VTPSSDRSFRRSEPPGHRGPFVPLLILVIGFLSLTAVQTTQLIGERAALGHAASQQATPLAAAQKVRLAADSLASKLQALADKGNADAKTVVAELKQRGVTISPNASTPTPP